MKEKTSLFFKCLIHLLAPAIYNLATLGEMVPKHLTSLDGLVLCKVIQHLE